MRKTRIFKTSLPLIWLLFTMTARPVASQIINIADVSLPFDVTVAGVPMQAGHYRILSVVVDSGRPLLVFRSDKGNSIEVLATRVAEPDNVGTEIVIGTHGKKHEIENLWIEGHASGYEFAR